MGRGCDSWWKPEGPDAPSGPQFPCNFRKGPDCEQESKAAALLLGLAGDAQAEPRRIFSLHSSDEPDVRSTRGPDYAERGGTHECFSPPRPPWRSHSIRSQSLGIGTGL